MSSAGEPGKPGEPPIGQQGGRGGEGGKGGAGEPEGGGGKGGAGGRGATGRAGPQGPQGEQGAGGKWYRRALSAWIVLFTAVVIWQVGQNRDHAREGQQAHDAICALKGDLVRRIEASQDFLAKHPNGIDGISATDISINIANQQLTLDALSPVRCTAEERALTPTGKAKP
jgi:hypothetical protein